MKLQRATLIGENDEMLEMEDDAPNAAAVAVGRMHAQVEFDNERLDESGIDEPGLLVVTTESGETRTCGVTGTVRFKGRTAVMAWEPKE